MLVSVAQKNEPFKFAVSACRLRDRGRMHDMSQSVYVRVFNDLELLRYVLRCAIERQLG